MAKAIKEEEAEKTRIEQDMAVLQSRLAHIKESLQKKVRATCPFGWAGPVSARAPACKDGWQNLRRQHDDHAHNNTQLHTSPQSAEVTKLSGLPGISCVKAQECKAALAAAKLQYLLANIDCKACLQVAAQAEYDRVLEETQTAYDRIVQSSEALLDILQRECSALGSTEQQRGQLTAC